MLDQIKRMARTISRWVSPTTYNNIIVSLPQNVHNLGKILRSEIDSISDTEVLREALHYYEEYLEDLQKGVKLQFKRQDGSVVNLDQHILPERIFTETINRNLKISYPVYRRIQKLAVTANVNLDELMRRAYRFFALIIVEINSGSTPHLLHPDGKIVPIKIRPKRPDGAGEELIKWAQSLQPTPN